MTAKRQARAAHAVVVPEENAGEVAQPEEDADEVVKDRREGLAAEEAAGLAVDLDVVVAVAGLGAACASACGRIHWRSFRSKVRLALALHHFHLLGRYFQGPGGARS